MWGDGFAAAATCATPARRGATTPLVMRPARWQFRCADHLADACAAAIADCSDAPGTGQATVAGCCDPVANAWTFQTCSFSDFFLGRTAGDLVPGKGSTATDCIAEWEPGNPLNVP